MIILIDTNVILDILQKRKPFFADSYQALQQAIRSNIDCLISASTATDIFYILRKYLGSATEAKEQLENLTKIVNFADVQGIDIHSALISKFSDFEDAVVASIAERLKASYILTRNLKDFKDSTVPAILPKDFLKKF